MQIKATIVFQRNWEAIHATTDGLPLNEYFDPNTNKKVSNRKYRYIINTGSSRSSKTASIIQCCDSYARSYPNKRITAWRDTKKDCKDTVLNDALRYMKMWGNYKFNQDFNKTESIFTYSNESTFEIHGTDDEEKVMGLNKAVAWLNEPYKISRDTFDQLDQRTEDFVIIDWNPKKSHWIEDIVKDPRTIVIHSTFKDNPFCPDEQRVKILSYQPVKWCDIVQSKLLPEHEAKLYDLVNNPFNFSVKQIKELSRSRENEAKRSANDFNWQVYGLGLKGERPNRIFHFEEIDIEEYRRIEGVVKVVGNDWGAVDPWGILEAKYYDGGLYLHELNYRSENEIRAKMTTTELAQINGEEEGIVGWLYGKLGVDTRMPVICDNNRLLKIALLRRKGYNAHPANKVAGSIIDGIDLLNNLRVYYTSTSENLKYEQENYSRKVDRYGVVLEEPEDTDNHLMDPARYVATYLQGIGVIKRM